MANPNQVTPFTSAYYGPTSIEPAQAPDTAAGGDHAGSAVRSSRQVLVPNNLLEKSHASQGTVFSTVQDSEDPAEAFRKAMCERLNSAWDKMPPKTVRPPPERFAFIASAMQLFDQSEPKLEINSVLTNTVAQLLNPQSSEEVVLQAQKTLRRLLVPSVATDYFLQDFLKEADPKERQETHKNDDVEPMPDNQRFDLTAAVVIDNGNDTDDLRKHKLAFATKLVRHGIDALNAGKRADFRGFLQEAYQIQAEENAPHQTQIDEKESAQKEASKIRPPMLGMDLRSIYGIPKGEAEERWIGGAPPDLPDYLPGEREILDHLEARFPGEVHKKHLSPLSLRPHQLVTTYSPDSAHPEHPGRLVARLELDFNDPQRTPVERAMNCFTTGHLLQKLGLKPDIHAADNTITLMPYRYGMNNDVGYEMPDNEIKASYVGENVLNVTSAHSGTTFFPEVDWPGTKRQPAHPGEVAEITHAAQTVWQSDGEKPYPRLSLRLSLLPSVVTGQPEEVRKFQQRFEDVGLPVVSSGWCNPMGVAIPASRNGQPGSFVDEQGRHVIRFDTHAKRAELQKLITDIGLQRPLVRPGDAPYLVLSHDKVPGANGLAYQAMLMGNVKQAELVKTNVMPGQRDYTPVEFRAKLPDVLAYVESDAARAAVQGQPVLENLLQRYGNQLRAMQKTVTGAPSRFDLLAHQAREMKRLGEQIRTYRQGHAEGSRQAVHLEQLAQYVADIADPVIRRAGML